MSTINHRRSMRLPHYDYSLAGAYFVTMVIHKRENLLGQINEGVVHLSAAGQVAEQGWAKLPLRYPSMESIAHIIMPNHMHGLVLLKEEQNPGVRLPELVRAFKTYTARRINTLQNRSNRPVWQRNYYERVVRDAEEMERIYAYILANPQRWAEDRENPECK